MGKSLSRRTEHQADTKNLTSSSKFSGSCVLTLQTLPRRLKVKEPLRDFEGQGLGIPRSLSRPQLEASQSKAGGGRGERDLGTRPPFL